MKGVKEDSRSKHRIDTQPAPKIERTIGKARARRRGERRGSWEEWLARPRTFPSCDHTIGRLSFTFIHIQRIPRTDTAHLCAYAV